MYEHQNQHCLVRLDGFPVVRMHVQMRVDISMALEDFKSHDAMLKRNPSPVQWVIVGGESGKNRRDCSVEAIVDIVDQCRRAMVPCFVKQDCALRQGQKGLIPDDVWAIKEMPIL